MAQAGQAGRATGTRGRRALVHIGLDKTGSTTLQAWLARNRAALRARGVAVDLLDDGPPPAFDMVRCLALYGEAAEPGWRPTRRLMRHFGVRSRGEVDRAVADLMARAEASIPSDGSLWVATCENLGTHLRTPEAVARQHRWLAARFDRVDYLCYLRDPVTWAPSAYAQAVKTGSPLSLDRFIEERGARDHLGLVRRWTDAAGEGRVHLRLYDELARRGDLIGDFAAALGVSPEGLEPVAPRNRSLAARRVRAEAVRNRLRLRLAPRGLGAWADRLDPLLRLADGGPRLALSPRQAARIRDLNRESDEALRAWKFPDRPTLFPEPAPSRPARPAPPMTDRTPCPSS